LLDAKKNLRLARELMRLDNFDCIALDDIGHVQHDRAEMEVLIALLAERYERKSAMTTSNLIFSGPDLQRSDDHCGGHRSSRASRALVLEFTGSSVRAEVAEERAARTKRASTPMEDA
jgi:DNA replication protein DnaC